MRMKKQQLELVVDQATNQENPVEICIAVSPEEKLAIYRLRYRIYAEELSWNVPGMEHDKKLLSDDLDDLAILVYAKIGSRLIGTVRVNIGRIEDFSPFWREVLSLQRFVEYDDRQLFAYTSKFMVLQDYRNSTVAYLLAAKAYELYCQHKIQFSFGICHFYLLRLYEQFGFRRFRGNFVAPGYGIATPYVLIVDDINHFRAVRSPFYRIARKRECLNTQPAEWFSKKFPENTDIINSQLISEDGLWNYLCTRYECLPNQLISILHRLSEAEAKKFLHCCGVVVRCQPGDQIAFRGDMCYELSVLIAGQLKSFKSRNATVAPGQCFGAPGLVYQRKHTEDIFAVTDAEILVLANSAFERFRHSHPDIAEKITQALSRKKRITA